MVTYARGVKQEMQRQWRLDYPNVCADVLTTLATIAALFVGFATDNIALGITVVVGGFVGALFLRAALQVHKERG